MDLLSQQKNHGFSFWGPYFQGRSVDFMETIWFLPQKTRSAGLLDSGLRHGNLGELYLHDVGHVT